MSDGTTAAPASGAQAETPPMPAVPASQLYRGSPRLLNAGARYSLGWQDRRSAGPGFVVVRMARLGGIKVLSRFPLTPDGWESAWHTLAGLDADAATAISATLAARAEQRRLAELDSGLVRFRSMTYDGGSGGAPLTAGQAYDLRFSDDRLTISPPYSPTAVTEVAYHDVDAAEVDRSGGRSSGETVAVVLAVALGGALLGLVILGLLGLFLGAMLFALIAGSAMASTNSTKAIVRLRGPDWEFFFSKAGQDSEEMRIQLSQPLMAIASARAARLPPPAEPAPPPEGSIPEQLTKLAALLADGLLSREEFEQLKARIIAQA